LAEKAKEIEGKEFEIKQIYIEYYLTLFIMEKQNTKIKYMMAHIKL
jgi:hypothetical protein